MVRQYLLLNKGVIFISIKEQREKSGMTQAELSARSGVNLQMIQKYEQGVKNINNAKVITVLKLADALGCEVKDIINDIE